MELAQEEEQLRAEAERRRAEEEELVKEVEEEEERAQRDVGWAQQMAKAWAQVHAEFVPETYTPPELHVFVPSGFEHVG